MNGTGECAARLDAVSHRYGGALALDEVSLDLPAGRMVGLIGPDGVGKSTVMALVAGAKAIQEGRVETLGADMSDPRARARAGRRLAFLPQGLGRNLYGDLSVAENLEFFGRLFGLDGGARDRRIAQLTEATGLGPFRDRLARRLSGGMKQKLGLCAALIHSPDLLLLDEPTTGIDPLSRRQFWELIGALREDRPGMSVLVSTAYMEEAARFDRLVAMNEGRVVAAGTPDELMERTGEASVEDAFRALVEGGGSARPEIPPRPESDGEAAIEAEGLTRRFGSFTAVDSVDLRIEKGEIFGFVGSNGSGKTTTMKMLTGLLAPTEGRAWLFGKQVDGHSGENRRRVGYMSQDFSLYRELTVGENLRLHAHLFGMTRDEARKRIEALVPRFGLEGRMDARAGTLPLGLRQRLSLAVAVIHRPETLILDEPTSGVDPSARDDFWKLLGELSREEGVTIFISTHFMNEAMRCDRIALMHAGRVLATDAPGSIVEEAGAETLEEAFVALIRDATGAGEEGAAPPAEIAAEPPGGASARFSLRRLLAYTVRETREVLRDPVRLAFAFLGSAVLLLVMAVGISQDVDEISFAALDRDRSPESRAYVAELAGSRYFERVGELTSEEELQRALQSGEIRLALRIPPGFGRAVRQGEAPEIAALIDGADTQNAGLVESYVQGAHRHYLARMAEEAGRPDAGTPIELEPRYLYNPSFESIYAMGPSLPALTLLLFPAVLMAVSVARERELGTITNFYVTPGTRAEFLIGKQLVYIVVALVIFAVLTVEVIWLLGVPLKGSLGALAAGAVVYAVAATGFGLLVSRIARTQVAAVFATSILSIVPSVEFSGLLEPVSSLTGPARAMGALWPTTYYLDVSVGAFTKGLGFGALWPDVLTLAAFGPVLVAAAVLLLPRQER